MFEKGPVPDLLVSMKLLLEILVGRRPGDPELPCDTCLRHAAADESSGLFNPLCQHWCLNRRDAGAEPDMN